MRDQAASALPAGASALVGRGRERAALGARLADVRALTLTGAGGSGKTRLALAVATDVRARFAHGACWVDLATIEDPGMVPAAVAGAAGVRQRLHQEPTDTLVAEIGGGDLLVVLDNCEHLVEACVRLVAPLLRACPGVRVLATSREPLRVDGEAIFPVAPLSLPPASACTAEAVGSADAVELFVLRARQARPDFALTDGNAAAVAEVCRRLDGLPLAVELAAARVRVLSPAQIAAGLSDRFALLSDGRRDALPRQRTLEASVRWSDDLLGDDERLVLARLSVFAGSFDLDGARAVAAGPGVAESSVLDLVAALVDRSLLQAVERDGQVRYRMLETIRAYARERLATLDDPPRTRDRHLEYYRQVAERARGGLVGRGPVAWVERLGAEVDDLRAAMDWAVHTQRPRDVLDIAEPTFTFWMVRGLYREMHRRLRAAVGTAGAGDAERARGLATASILALMGGDYPAGHALAAEAVPLARAQADDATLARALLFRGWCGFLAGEAGVDADADLQQAVALAERAGDEETRLRAMTYAGTLRLDNHSYDEGRAQLEQAIAGIETAGFAYLLAPARAFLAFGLVFPGAELDRGREQARQALDLGRELGLQAFVAVALTALGVADTLHGDEAGARRHLAEALAVARRNGLATFAMVAQHWTAVAAYRFDPAAPARQQAEALLQAARDTGGSREQAMARCLLGLLALREGRHPEARAHLQAARDASVEPRFPGPLGRSLLGLARLHEAAGDLETAWERAHDGLEVLAGAGDRVGTADAVETVAGLAAALGRPERALRLLAATDRFRARTGVGRFPLEADAHDRLLRAAASLDADADEACRAEGATMSLDDAVAYARRGRGRRARPRIGWESLTPTEREVARLVAQGCGNAEIGERLLVSVNTVKTHLSRVYAKVAVAGRAELAAQAALRDL